MRTSAITVLILSASLLAIGMPDVPDVPDTDLPEIEIPGLDILDGVKTELDGLSETTSGLTGLIPELSVLDEVSLKLAELRETDPDIIGLQEQIDALRAELVDARAQIEAVTTQINQDIQEVTSSIDTFVEGLPVSID